MGLEVEPYSDSGSNAAAMVHSRRKRELHDASVRDADMLEAQGHAVFVRSRRNFRLGVLALVAVGSMMAWVGAQVATAYDGTVEGAAQANWSMLGVVLGIGLLNFIWGWLGTQRRLRATAARLIRRAEYQRGLAALDLTEVDT